MRLNLVKGYYQAVVNKASRKKTAFWDFSVKINVFWFENKGATFQRLIEQILGDLNFVFVYLDDILISSGTKEENRTHLFASELEFFSRCHH